MFGRIMPAPLAMPVMVTVLPLTATVREAALATVSVVMMACAAACQLSAPRSACAAGRPATRRSTGSGSRMTPVENGSTCAAPTPSSSPTASQVACAAWRPGSPVPALAMPVLITSARISPPAARWLRHNCTGAAQKRFCVNTPATVQPAIERDQRQVAAVLLADAGLGDAETDTGDGKQGFGGGSGVVDGHP